VLFTAGYAMAGTLRHASFQSTRERPHIITEATNKPEAADRLPPNAPRASRRPLSQTPAVSIIKKNGPVLSLNHSSIRGFVSRAFISSSDEYNIQNEKPISASPPQPADYIVLYDTLSYISIRRNFFTA
jgi:hypothetical protein